MIRSQAVLDSSRGQPCSANFAGICCADPATTVWAHLNGHRFGKGAGIKAHDILGFHACFACHAYYDVGHGTKSLMTDAELAWAVLGAVTTTWVRLIAAGIVKVPMDKPKASHERPVAPRKAKADRQTIPAHVDPWPKGRAIPSRPMRSKP
ncbi:nuclease domain-containing protein [Devosia lacusdianchii]|uniref:nuclease domain-containing protein n=1 Tax=Devosia lacusdianchii TaxID=2917991 RepID=UPI001F06BDDD|nr:nuclease domain-containing protein [Devosia sp. JXJ CY 41]